MASMDNAYELMSELRKEKFDFVFLTLERGKATNRVSIFVGMFHNKDVDKLRKELATGITMLKPGYATNVEFGFINKMTLALRKELNPPIEYVIILFSSPRCSKLQVPHRLLDQHGVNFVEFLLKEIDEKMESFIDL